jgi:precorrin-3B synthase
MHLCHPVPVLDQDLAAYAAPTAAGASRGRPDRCPGVTRPWLADDGALVRLRLVGGALPTTALRTLIELSDEYGDGALHLTSRANIQIRSVPHRDGVLPPAFVAGVRAAGLLPSTSHELVRNVMVSPLSGRVGGRADLRPVARELDRLLLADPSCADLSGRFLYVLDDGRGDLLDRTSDLVAVAVDADTVQVRAGSTQWGPVVDVSEAAGVLHSLTRRFLDLRGDDPGAAWHVDELDAPLLDHERDERARVTSPRPSYGRLRQGDGRLVDHVEVPEGRLDADLAARLLEQAGDELVVTPWHSMLLPDLEAR